MSNKYVHRMDEKTLAFQLDEARKATCNCDQGCEGCPWALPEEKCLLLTAENQISERHRARLQNMKKHYRKVVDFLMNLKSMTLKNGAKVTKCRRPEGVFVYEDPSETSDFPVPFMADSALDLIKIATYLEELDED